MIERQQMGRFGHTFTSLNPWTTIAIWLALVNYVTSRSKSWISIEPRTTHTKQLRKESLSAKTSHSDVDNGQVIPSSQPRSMWTPCLYQLLKRKQIKKSQHLCSSRDIPYQYSSCVADHNSFEVRTVTHNLYSSSRDRRTPQHAYRSVPEHVK